MHDEALPIADWPETISIHLPVEQMMLSFFICAKSTTNAATGQ
jgi:hypothetical protein